ncbi:Choline-sulfatase [Stieleria varia]|uniref:Choline-sulfatase n=2 Tax=Stieleria varia TaxID=2528005 RepID=A0A5C6B584_9BACT|nr:Choline-sulfatase [Stieleria varia]
MRHPQTIRLGQSTPISSYVAFLFAIAMATFLLPRCLAEEPQNRPNVLFIAVDDLRPELNCYGKSHIHSPNIDRLASSGMLFQRSYCMVPTCGASRSSLMTGLRPTKNRFVNYLTRADKDAPGITTLNTHFKNNGYHTVSNGKVFHHTDDNVGGWSEAPWRPNAKSYQLAENQKLQGRKNAKGKLLRGPAFEAATEDDEQYADGMTAAKTIDDLRRLSKQDQPFFLAVGFMKPHLPFVAPQKYWNLYDRNQIQLPANYKVPKDAPAEAIHSSGELRAYHGIPPQGPVSDETALSMIHGYYACVSFTDAQVGRVLSELDQLGLRDNTIVVLWGDHGWNLGDHTLWCKHSCFESSMHAPLIVRAPGIQGGTKTNALTEFIDIYPTLCDLTGLEKPSHLAGRSFTPLLHDPDMPWKSAAIGRFQSGDTIRTDRYRFSEYTTRDGKQTARMLYDHEADPLENINVAEQSSLTNEVDKLTTRLENEKGK